ncbi:MAG: PfkB family carbohydrate kinase [Candidatus Hodarchaeales archaeon]
MKKPIVPVILGQIVLDTVIHHYNHEMISESENDYHKRLILGGPPFFTGSIGFILSQQYSWIEKPIIFAYSCPKANSRLRLAGFENLIIKDLKLRPNCPHFKLVYDKSEGKRTILLNNPPLEFNPNDFNWKLNYSPIVIVGSVFHEFDSQEIFSFLRDNFSYVAFDPQGCFRQLLAGSRITYKNWWDRKITDKTDCIKISENEAKFLNLGENNQERVEKILETSVSSVLLTRGNKGAILGIKDENFNEKKVYNVPAYPCQVIDETGAGDVFLFSYVIHYYAHKDPLSAVAFATSITSLLIEQKRFSWSFDRETIDFRQRYIQSRISDIEF